MSRDDYASREGLRKRAYREAYASPEVQAWIASLTPEQRRHAEEMGLLKPSFDTRAGVMLEDQKADVQPRTQDALPDADEATSPKAAFMRRLGKTPKAAGDFASSPRKYRALLSYLTEPRKAALRYACFAYLMGNGTCEGIAKVFGMTRQSFHYHAMLMQKTLGLPALGNSKSPKARKAYKLVNGRANLHF